MTLPSVATSKVLKSMDLASSGSPHPDRPIQPEPRSPLPLPPTGQHTPAHPIPVRHPQPPPAQPLPDSPSHREPTPIRLPQPCRTSPLRIIPDFPGHSTPTQNLTDFLTPTQARPIPYLAHPSHTMPDSPPQACLRPTLTDSPRHPSPHHPIADYPTQAVPLQFTPYRLPKPDLPLPHPTHLATSTPPELSQNRQSYPRRSGPLPSDYPSRILAALSRPQPDKPPRAASTPFRPLPDDPSQPLRQLRSADLEPRPLMGVQFGHAPDSPRLSLPGRIYISPIRLANPPLPWPSRLPSPSPSQDSPD